MEYTFQTLDEVKAHNKAAWSGIIELWAELSRVSTATAKRYRRRIRFTLLGHRRRW